MKKSKPTLGLFYQKNILNKNIFFLIILIKKKSWCFPFTIPIIFKYDF